MDFSELRSWGQVKRIEKVIESLKENGFNSQFYTDLQSGIRDLLASIPRGERIGVGGSVTVRELGLIENLKERGCEIIEHWGGNETDDDELRRKANSCQYYLSGTNTITEKGHLVNIDGIGNRIAALAYGPRYVFIVAGINKIVRDLDTAIWRIKNIAAPSNAKRVGAKTPCADTGICSDCSNRGRICRAILILERPPFRSNYQIFIFNKIMGF